MKQQKRQLFLTLPEDNCPPPPPTQDLLTYLHKFFHANAHILQRYLKPFLSLSPGDLKFLKDLSTSCDICQKANPNTPSHKPTFPCHQARGYLPGSDWQIDFTHMPPVKKHKFLLVLVDTFTWWVEAFPTTNKRVSTVSNILLSNIIPQFVLPTSLQSDNSPEFTSLVTQSLVKLLGIPWHFHIPYHPQSSGKVERTNRTLKNILTKLSLELHIDWIQLLPLALLRVRSMLRRPSLISPFEPMYGRPTLPPGILPEPP